MTPHTPEGTVIDELDRLYAKVTDLPWETSGRTCGFLEDMNNIYLAAALVNAWPTIRTMLRPDSSGEAVREACAKVVEAERNKHLSQDWANSAARGTLNVAAKAIRNLPLPTLPAASGWVSDDAKPELAEAVEHIKRIGLAWDNVFPQVSIDGTVEHNPAAIKLNTAVKIARDWLITRASVQPKPQPKIPRTTHG